jgi:hypothetical protein
MKHTSGPWEVDGFDTTSVIKNEGSEIWPQWKHICRCDYGYADPEKHLEGNKANAKLIAAAPELLEALINMRKAFDKSNEKYADWVATSEVYDAMAVIDSAIKKAV